MTNKKVLTVQDISCYGQCSLTVALPIISACGVETCILPSAVLSTHTGGFKGFTFRDLTQDMPAIINHWKSENIKFDAIYTGYLGSIEQVGIVKNILSDMGKQDSVKIVDPAFADHGKLYSIFNLDYVNTLKTLIPNADILLPNVSEASFLTGLEYKEIYDEDYILSLFKALKSLGAKTIVMTGVGYKQGYTGVAVYQNDTVSYYEHNKLEKSCHGTGDIYASAFTGALLNGKTVFDSAKIAADYTVRCMINTIDDSTHWYGAKFETALPYLMQLLDIK
ncbi:MAG: pyridoxamine kinase [Clostridia bacterium]|nr:pyridoxamine kinase [Clostridia bacterium]